MAENDTGFNNDADFYSLLQCSPEATKKDIQKQYYKLSKHMHPDKSRIYERVLDPDQPGFVPTEATTDLKQREEIFIDIQRAYVYLTNPLTKIIYDEFGVPGLAVYEKQKTKFTELQEEIRGIESSNESAAAQQEGENSQIASILNRQVATEKEQVIKRKVILKSKQLIETSVSTHILNKYQRIFSMELGIDAKAFCNYFMRFYHAGELSSSMRLIRPKHFVGVG